jgi:hypothetical protein
MGLTVERDQDPAADDWGLNYPFSVAWRAYTRYYHSNFVALPDEGGILDQDELLMDDIDTLAARADAVMRRLRRESERGSADVQDDGTLERVDIYR